MPNPKDELMRRSVVLFACVFLAALLVGGTALAVTKNCSGGGNCQGTSDDDRLYGSPMQDTMFGRGGSDNVYGYGSGDMLKGGPGADLMYGGGEDDKGKGGSGADRIFGDGGDDTLRGGTIEKANDGVRDFLNCGSGTDTVYFTPGQDSVADNCEVRNPPLQ